MAKDKVNSKALVQYDEEFAKLAAEAAQQEANTGGGSFISIKGGHLRVNDAPVPNDQAAVVLLDSVLLNAYYEGEYDEDNPQPPVCYAFGRDEATMQPHGDVPNKQHDDCATCPHNVFGTAERGNGKRCKNGRRVALMSAGTLEGSREHSTFKRHEELEQFERGERFYLNVPPTSINTYGAYVKQLAGALKLPPFGVFTKLSLVEGKKGGTGIALEPIDRLPKELHGVLLARHRAEREQIMFAFPKPNEAPAKGAKGKGTKGKGNKPAVTGRRY